MKLSLIASLASLVFAAPTVAMAQGAATMPSETVKAQTATGGKTDVAKGGFVTGAANNEEDVKSATEASVAAGGLFSSGNARTVALTGSGKFRHRADEHQFSAAAAVNFARAGKRGEAVDTTVENYQGLLRYDYFLTNNLSLFLQSSARRDRFQALDLRLNIDPGVAYYFINTKAQRLQAELGYDLQHDVRRDADIASAPPPRPDKTQTLHNARAFVGYENKLYKEVSFITSLEYIQNFANLETYRLIWDVGLKSGIADKLAIATTYTMRYENKPLPNIEQTDSIASVNLVYTLF
jgi:putative salt-induced outer membrane protein YdiY